MSKVSDLFEVRYGHSLELNKLVQNPAGINFVSRTARNNGVSAKVSVLDGVDPSPAGTLTVAYGGSVLETFLQTEPFYSGYHIGILTPKVEMSDAVKLYYCACIRANKYRYNYGRQANRTLKDIEIPSIAEIPSWVNAADTKVFEGANSSLNAASPSLSDPEGWKLFSYDDLFDIRKGKRLTKANMLPGEVPFIGSSDSHNGLTATIGQHPIHDGNVISLSYNGSVGEAFYQPAPFWATDDVNVLYPKGFDLTPARALFLCAVIRLEKFRFNYGRKWHTERMRESSLKLPVTTEGIPDWSYMESYISSLPYSSQI